MTARPRLTWRRRAALCGAALGATLVGPPPAAADPSPEATALAGRAKKQDDRPVASYIGFRRLSDGSARVFVQLTGKPATITKRAAGNRLTYTLGEVRVSLRNNRNPLLALDFDSQVVSAQLVAVGKDVNLVIDLRSPVTATEKLEPLGAGANFVVDVPRPAK
ncbi:MAG: hypothetical protein OZ921_09615 [Sorangiineae bacterium]|nr:hypothetical protein [Polyangiaceae bacterium]MEB2322761.1 hypothetical protein [Sorangiineae bacterium]